MLRLAGTLAACALTGCATYHAEALPPVPNLVSSISALDTSIPVDDGLNFVRIDTLHPLSIDQIGFLAILNNPDLKSEAGTIEQAQAGIVQASLLPNPVAAISYGALISGPATTSSFSAALSQSLAQIITRQARIRSADFRAGQVDAGQLWREWQVAEKARQLAADIYAGDRLIKLTEEEIALLTSEIDQVTKEIAAGNLTLAAQAPLAAAQATAENALVPLKLDWLKNWQGLDGLLGLDPNVRFRIAAPALGRPPRDIEGLLADLPERRPDLAALQLGYESAQEDIRAAILGQFPALTLGSSYNKDTSDVISAGPTFDLALPVFDRNQGHIASAAATRSVLYARYQAALDSAVANVRSLFAQIRQLTAGLARARAAATAAQSVAATARKAYAQNNLDQRTVTDYQTTALQRRLAVVTIERQINEDRIFLDVELGLGLPEMRIALQGSSPL